jgi:hypothetical protein
MAAPKITVGNIKQQIDEFAPRIFKNALVYEKKHFIDERSVASIHDTAKPETAIHPNAITDFLMTNITQEEFTQLANEKLNNNDAAQGIRQAQKNILQAMKKSPQVVEQMFQVLDTIISFHKQEKTLQQATKVGEYFDESNLVRIERQIKLFVDLLKTNLEQTNKSLETVLNKLKLKNPKALAKLFAKQPEEQAQSDYKPKLATISSPVAFTANTLTVS